ncbi:sulfide/dihydroorotate dehydrogenase-like FAD/NAD-binding protein [Alkaliphilus sp. B6464]|uniref:sulfide/dihydroorotate dehydrogenase-like FAD/NAD-binding protein n=1 Tax=Alkaliphilus sp. B6464 TaxID=2731219 RepID=UPI001BABEA64|nr:sulfide/dihydroorotate dehydrogenase-like FAD/NAD-binding protein [Alkaliphilus sp. B6464]QUH20734.1 sulfide/dihydroorotate dehydrogenase-like FAD/NAD-binding protein [Alkaliphilus sp. B6464]
MDFKQWQCVDAGSEYCPCYLAEENDCITCTQLQGKSYCDCNWRGVCIYNDFYFSENKRKDTRTAQEFPILDGKVVNDIIILSIQVTKYMARVLKQPGSYVFVRDKNNDYFFDVPISIMDSDEEKSLIKIAIEVRGVKTKKLMGYGDTIMIRGPYWNGIFGLDYLKTTKNDRCLVLARGIAQAPAILVIKQLLKNNNNVDIIVNKRANEYNFVNEYFNLDSIQEVDMGSNDVAILCKRLMEENNYKLIFIGGSDSLQGKIIRSIEELNQAKFVTTNNNAICCGEGICGACAKMNEDGIWIKTCKVQRVD